LGTVSGAPNLYCCPATDLAWLCRAPAGGNFPRPRSVGQYFWEVSPHNLLVDPAEELFAIMLIQGPGQRDYFRTLFRDLVYAAFDGLSSECRRCFGRPAPPARATSRGQQAFMFAK